MESAIFCVDFVEPQATRLTRMLFEGEYVKDELIFAYEMVARQTSVVNFIEFLLEKLYGLTIARIEAALDVVSQRLGRIRYLPGDATVEHTII